MGSLRALRLRHSTPAKCLSDLLHRRIQVQIEIQNRSHLTGNHPSLTEAARSLDTNFIGMKARTMKSIFVSRRWITPIRISQPLPSTCRIAVSLAVFTDSAFEPSTSLVVLTQFPLQLHWLPCLQSPRVPLLVLQASQTRRE